MKTRKRIVGGDTSMDALITVEGVEKDFGNQVKALDQINLEIASGDIYGIIGMSGAGKSTLINKLGSLNIKTDEISKALGRGKHTTRHVEIYEIGEIKIMDTPGFSALDLNGITKEQLRDSFIEFKKYSCRFKDCMHNKEIDCGVKTAVGKEILPSRYENYIKLLGELNESSGIFFK